MNNEGDQERCYGCEDSASADDSAGPSRWWLSLLLLPLLFVEMSARSNDIPSFSYPFPTLSTSSIAARQAYTLQPLQPSPLHTARRGYDQIGLALSIGGGVSFVSNSTANFYSGHSNNVNTINRVLHSERYGYPIWLALTEQGLISDAIGNYHQLQVAEYGNMDYALGIQLHFGFRYALERGWGWGIKFDYCKYNVRGAFLLDATNGTGIASNTGRYITCPIAGSEKRIFFDLGISKRIRLASGYDIGIDAGININNVTVLSNDIQVGGVATNILDVWNGLSPADYVQEYDYINQGGLGVGAFAAVSFGITLPNLTALSLAYTTYYTKLNLEGYERYALQSLISVRIDINNIDFFD